MEKGRVIAQPKTEDEKSKYDFTQWSSLHYIYFKRQLETIFNEFSIDEKYFNGKIDISLYFDETDKIITKKEGFKYKILGDILEDPRIIDIFTKETLEYFKLVLSNDLGLNTRNNLSHGIITIGECNENKSNIVFHILLFLMYM